MHHWRTKADPIFPWHALIAFLTSWTNHMQATASSASSHSIFRILKTLLTHMSWMFIHTYINICVCRFHQDCVDQHTWCISSQAPAALISTCSFLTFYACMHCCTYGCCWTWWFCETLANKHWERYPYKQARGITMSMYTDSFIHNLLSHHAHIVFVTYMHAAHQANDHLSLNTQQPTDTCCCCCCCQLYVDSQSSRVVSPSNTYRRNHSIIIYCTDLLYLAHICISDYLHTQPSLTHTDGMCIYSACCTVPTGNIC